MKDRPTVFFGPFIGEFGWEMLHWQGWVRKVCRSEFRDHRRIACSAPGRHPFYPYVDEFWPLPDNFLKLNPSGHGYYTDGWRHGYPGRQHQGYTVTGVLRSLRRGQRPEREWLEQPVQRPDMEPVAESMLTDFKKRLSADTKFFVPWKPNHYSPDGLDFGMYLPRGVTPRSTQEYTRAIDHRYQVFEYLEPTEKGRSAFARLCEPDKRLIALYPRCRAIRRPDKNWGSGKYLELIARLQEVCADHTVAVFGEPSGSYFADGVPLGCLNLVSVPSHLRLDLQIAALRQAAFALGTMSGALAVALGAGCPALIWGFGYHTVTYWRANTLHTPMIYYPDIDPTVDIVLEMARSLRRMVENGIAWQSRRNGNRRGSGAPNISVQLAGGRATA